jgi:hypothetical protein
MTFKEALKHITGEKRPKRAAQWIERFIAGCPDDDKKFLKDWYRNKGNLDLMVADLYRSFFAEWKKEEKSRTAKKSRSKRGRVRRKDDKRLGARPPG